MRAGFVHYNTGAEVDRYSRSRAGGAVIDPVTLLQELIRFDTTNPPGNEEACVAHIEALLARARHRVRALREDAGQAEPDRASRRARRRAAARAVRPRRRRHHRRAAMDEAARSAARSSTAIVWGRGALDMKGGVAMCVSAFIAAHEAGSATPLLLLILSDEENGGDDGAMFIADEHPDALAGAKHALGEFGGVTQWIGGPPLLPDSGGGEAVVLAARARARHWRARRARREGRRDAEARRHAADARPPPAAGARHPARPRLVRADGRRAAAPAGAAPAPAARSEDRRSRSARTRPARPAAEPRDPQHGQPDDRPRRRQDQRHPERDRAGARRAAPAGLPAGAT